MGCGCGKNKDKNKNMKSSRMPSNDPPKKIGNISVPNNMNYQERKATIIKIRNDEQATKRKSNVMDYLREQRHKRNI
jgi:hypothetical protein